MAEPIRLSKNEDTALRAFEYLDTDWALPFKAIGHRSGLEQRLVRRTVRALARKGVLVYRRGLWSEDYDQPAGSGYGLTERGAALVAHLIAAADAERAALEAKSTPSSEP